MDNAGRSHGSRRGDAPGRTPAADDAADAVRRPGRRILLLNVAPGDPVTAMVGERADSATIARLRAELRLDDPLPTQFIHYVGAVVRGDLGRSYITQRPIAQDLRERLPRTAELALAAMTLA